MKIVRDTPAQLIVSHVTWKGPLVWIGVAVAFVVIVLPSLRDGPVGGLALFGVLGVTLPLIMALLGAERAMLILDQATGYAEIRRRDIKGLHCHRFPMAEVHGSRIRSEYRPRHASAATDKTRMLALYVPRGMDEGFHNLTRHQVPTKQAKSVSRRINQWMRAVRVAYEGAYTPPSDPDADQSPP